MDIFVILSNELFWVSAAFTLFVFFSYRPILKKILTLIDQKVLEIKNEIDEMVNLKEEAKLQLSEAQFEYKNIVAENTKKNANASQEAMRIINDARDKLRELSDHNQKMVHAYNEKLKQEIVDAIKRDVIVTVFKELQERYRNNNKDKNKGDILDMDFDTLKKIWN